METKAVGAGFAKYLSTLVVTVLFPLQFLRMIKLARSHEDIDPRAVQKVAAGAVVGLLLAGFGTYLVLDFEAGATHGIYDTFDGRLSNALGNEQYKAHLSAADSAQARVDLADRKIAEGEDPAIWQPNRDAAEHDRDSQLANASALEANHALYEAVHEFVLVQDDAGVRSTIAARGAIDFPDLDERVDNAFDRKDRAQSDMGNFLLWFVWPGVIGVLFAPIIFAMGTVLKRAFVPSETVGYKQYPGAAMALFLLFGGFGVPALFFAAWTFQDMEERSTVGQIAL